ncbi:PfkB family carbohydrate kinase [Leifsonia aquatica]|uniref:PfkB family carbohydrate kinase n=1 Tax=Leifsonia aquatica TaxID=144185 RepID=UPI00046819D5|nr:PfkB family carbohydrate kinase [Leifsonia aquatica]
MSGTVAVVGSVNLDIVISVDRRPGAGETVTGSGVQEVLGGKGANQAVAAARVVPTILVAAVGGDGAGRAARAQLADAAVGTAALRSSPLPTGRAYIVLSADAENSIVVVPMANSDLTAGHVVESLEQTGPSTVLAQLEVPPGAVAAAAAWCERSGARFILNPSPITQVDESIIAAADPLIVNRHEAAQLCGLGGGHDQPLEALASALVGLSRSVVITDGPRGAVTADGRVTDAVAAPVVTAVDTTGAGDAFAGTLAARLAAGDTLPEAARRAVAEASRLVRLPRSER